VIYALPGAAQEDEPAIDPRAERLLRDMGEFLQAADNLTLHAEILMDDLWRGRIIQYGASVDLSLSRPDQLWARVVGDLRDREVWYQDGVLNLLDHRKDVYMTEAIPGPVDSMMDFVVEEYGVTLPLLDFIYSDPYGVLMENVETADYVGLHSVLGVPCHHLVFTQENIDWQIWIEVSNVVVPRRLVIDDKFLEGSPRYGALISEWQFPDRLPDARFTFEPPPGAIEIEFLPKSKTP
jgi:hypothetical protein